MPESVFRCDNCGKKNTVIFPIGQKIPDKQHCSDCGKLMRLISKTESNNVTVGRPVLINPDREETQKSMPFVFQKEEKLISFGEVIEESEYCIDIEETQELGEPFVVMANGKGKKRYFKRGEEYELGTELIPLSKAELKELAIEESANDNFFEEIYHIGESVIASD